MNEPEPIIGIDLGTTFSLVAHVGPDGPRVLRDETGEARLPSVVALHHGDEGVPRLTIGWEARRHAVEHPRSTIYSVKRLIGKGPAEVEHERGYLAYAVVAGPRETLLVDIDGRRFTPEEISAAVLRELRRRAERFLGRPVRRAVITVPAYFDDAQRQATRDAGQAAGLDVLRIINEPTAAALAYGIGLGRRGGRRPAGDAQRSATDGAESAQGAGGTRSVPLPHCSDPAREARAATAAAESPRPDEPSRGAPETVAIYDLGGGTFDLSILRIDDDVFQVLSTAGDTHLGGDDFDRTLMDLVRAEVRGRFGLEIDSPATRQALRSLAENVKIRLSEHAEARIELDLGSDRVYERAIRREEFERLIEPLVARTLERCRRALGDARLSVADIDQVVLVGGSTRIPLVRRRVAELFQREPYTALNPDEVVAVGAAMQAAVLNGQDLGLLLLDVTPLSLGVETMGGAMSKLVLRNTTIPCRAVEQFTTFVDGQTAIRLTVLQGERELAADCRKLAEFELRGIPPMPAGIPKVQVEFLIDANGILSVSARELRSGAAASIQVVPNHGLTRDEVERITRESIAHARDDIAAHRRIDLLNQVAFDSAKAEQMLAKFGASLDAAERGRIEREIAALRAAAETEQDLDRLHEALQAFGRGTLRLAEIGIRETLKA